MQLSSVSNMIETFKLRALDLVKCLEVELSMFDTMVRSSRVENTSFLYNLIMKLQALDQSTVARYLTDHNEVMLEVLEDSEVKNEGRIIDGRIFTSRGAPKKPQDDKIERRRRQSFAAVSYSDVEVILTTEGIKTMSDLDILFSLNAFFLPYCGGKKERSMYEHFFDVFLRKVHQKEKAHSSFTLLQESIMIVQKISEAWMNLIEIILEILHSSFVRLKTHHAMLNPSLKTSFNSEPSDEAEVRLIEILTVIGMQNKMFRMIGTGSLTDVNSKRAKLPILMVKPESFVNKLHSQVEVVSLARETDMITIEACLSIIQPYYDEYPEFVSDLKLYIESFRTFRLALDDKTGSFQTFTLASLNMCITFDLQETELSSRLESPRRSPKEGNRWFSPRKSSSGSNSPKNKKE